MIIAPGQAVRSPVPPPLRGRVYSNPGIAGIVLTNSFEGGTSGTGMTSGNTGGASGRAFDAVNISGAGAAAVFSNAHSAHGGLAGELTFPSGVAAKAYCSWTFSMGTQATTWFRLYLYHTANPAVAIRVWQADVNGATLCSAVTLNAAGTLSMTNAAGTFLFTTTATVPLNQWYRVEGFVTGSATAGQAELKLYKVQDSSIADESRTSSAAQNTFGKPNAYRFGSFSNITETSAFNLWLDDAGLSNSGYLGPVVVPPPLSVSVQQATRPRLSPQALTLSGAASARLAAGTGNIAGPASGRGAGGGQGARGAPVRNPSQGPAFRQFTQAVQARLPQQPLLRGRNSGNPGVPARTPGRGPVFRQRTTPARAVLPPPHPQAGRAASDPGGPVVNPFAPVPPFVPSGQPAGVISSFTRAGVTMATPLLVTQLTSGPPVLSQGQPAGTLGLILRTGVAAASKTSPPVNPRPGPAFRPATSPARTRPALPPRGRAAGNPGIPVPAAPPAASPPFRPDPPRVRPVLPPRGRVVSGPGGPVRNPVQGPVFRPAVQAVRVRIPQAWSKGRACSSPGTASYRGPVFRQATEPSRLRVTLPPRGRVSFNPGAPVRNPPSPGPVFIQAAHPVTAKLPVPFLKGRASSNPGAPAVHLALRIPPPRGPVRAAQPPPSKGRTWSNPGIPARNPGAGPQVYPLHGPIGLANRAPGPRRTGRTSSGPGGPVRNIPLASPLVRVGTPHLDWETQVPYFRWATGTPGHS